MGWPTVDGGAGREQRLGEGLAAEHAGEAVGLGRGHEPVAARGLGHELERVEETVERGEWTC